MANIVDAWVITLGLKDQDFVRQARLILELQEKMRAGARQQHKEQEEQGRASIATFSQIKREVLGLASVILGGMGITEFAKQTIALNADVGRLSVSLNMSTEQISAWQGAIRAMGGTSQEASNDLMSIVKAFEDIQLTGNSPMIPVLRQLGFGLDDLKDPTQFLLKLSDRLSAMPDKREAFNLGQRLGLSTDMINLLIQGRQKTQEYLDAASKAYAIHQRDAAAAAEAQKQWSNLKDAYQRVGDTILVDLAPALIKLADGLEDIAVWLNKHPNVAMGLFGAALYVVAAGAFRAAAGLVAFSAAAAGAPLGLLARLFPGLAAGAGIGAGAAGAAVAGGVALSLVPGRLGTLGQAATGRSIDEQLKALRSQLGTDAPQDYVKRRIAELMAKRAVLGGAADFATPIGAAAAGGRGVSARDAQGQVADFFRTHGASAAGAAGIAAGVVAEGGSEFARDEYDKRGRFAYGLFQLRGSLQRELFAKYGPNANLAQQLQFVLSKLQSDPSLGGASIFSATNPGAALQTFIGQFLRPGAGAAGDLNRGLRALSIGNLTVNVTAQPGADGKQVGRDVYAGIVAQANRGMS